MERWRLHRIVAAFAALLFVGVANLCWHNPILLGITVGLALGFTTALIPLVTLMIVKDTENLWHIASWVAALLLLLGLSDTAHNLAHGQGPLTLLTVLVAVPTFFAFCTLTRKGLGAWWNEIHRNTPNDPLIYSEVEDD
jgi:hypothetical protein